MLYKFSTNLLVSILIQSSLHGAAINQQDISDLFYACQKKNITLVVGILSFYQQKSEKKTLVNTKNKDGKTLLHVAIEEEDPDIVAFLLTTGADMYIPNKDDLTPLHCALHHDIVILKTMLLSLPLEKRASTATTLLRPAIMLGYIDKIKMLLLFNASIHQTKILSETALHVALKTQSNSLEIQLKTIRILLEHGARLNIATKDSNDIFEFLEHHKKQYQPKVYRAIRNLLIQNPKPLKTHKRHKSFS